MARSRQPLHRRRKRRNVGSRIPRKTFLVFCEGARTEPEYLKALKQEPGVNKRASVQFRQATIGISPPLSLVKAAVKTIDRAEEEKDEIDEVWCLFDVEWPQNHPNLDQTVALAKRSKVHIAVSNPSFELWLSLHFQDDPGWLDTKAAERLRKRHDGSTGKGVDGATYMPLRAKAAGRARVLAEKHEKERARFLHDNPSSGMYLLLQALDPTIAVGTASLSD